MSLFEPKLSDFLLDLRRSLAHKGFAKILNISTGMPAVFSNPYASRSQHISSQKIAQLMVFGGYQVIEEQMRLDLRLVEVETGRIRKAAQKTVSSTDLPGWLNAAKETAAQLF